MATEEVLLGQCSQIIRNKQIYIFFFSDTKRFPVFCQKWKTASLNFIVLSIYGCLHYILPYFYTLLHFPPVCSYCTCTLYQLPHNEAFVLTLFSFCHLRLTRFPSKQLFVLIAPPLASVNLTWRPPNDSWIVDNNGNQQRQLSEITHCTDRFLLHNWSIQQDQKGLCRL